MKKGIVFLSCIILTMACKKEVVVPTTNDFVGKWTWIKTEGGIGGVVKSPEKNSPMTYTFTDKELTYPTSDAINAVRKYTFTKGKSLIMNTIQPFLNIETNATNTIPEKQMYRFSAKKDTLTLVHDVFDGETMTFVKNRTDDYKEGTYVGIDPKLCPSPCCGGSLVNIEGITYMVNEWPSDFKFDTNKNPQKLLLKYQYTPISCARVIEVTSAKLK